MRTLIPIFLILINILSFCLFGMDKRRAQKHAWRISEKALFCFALCGGSIGALCGMHVFHHKTKKSRFRFGLPLILAVQAAAVFCLLVKLS